MIGWTKVAKEYVDKLGNKGDTILLAGQGRKKSHKRQLAKIKDFSDSIESWGWGTAEKAVWKIL